MKHAPEKVFIKENGEYIEISNQEHEARKSADKQYTERKFVLVQGCLMECTEKFYTDFYKNKEREKYLRKLAKSKSVLSIDAFDSEDDNGTDFIADDGEDVCESVIQKIMIEKLVSVLPLLSDDERELIEEHFYNDVSQVQLAKKYGKNQSNISRDIAKILLKLRKLMEN